MTDKEKIAALEAKVEALTNERDYLRSLVSVQPVTIYPRPYYPRPYYPYYPYTQPWWGSGSGTATTPMLPAYTVTI